MVEVCGISVSIACTSTSSEQRPFICSRLKAKKDGAFEIRAGGSGTLCLRNYISFLSQRLLLNLSLKHTFIAQPSPDFL